MRPIVAIAVVMSCFAQSAEAQLPAARLDGIFPAGAQVGTTVDVTLTGIDLDDAAELHFSHPGLTAKPKMAAATPFDKERPIPNQFVVTVASDVPVGSVDVRARGRYGLSNPRAFELSNLEEVTEVEPNNGLDEAVELALPKIVNGRIERTADVDRYRFTASAGERLLVECRTRRIDSLLEPVITIYDAQGRELVNHRCAQMEEALVDFHVPATGEYSVRVADAYYRGNDSYGYRLAIGPLPHLDFIFPPAGPAGVTSQFTVYGRNLPGGKPSDYAIDGQRLESLAVKVAIPKDPAKLLPLGDRVDPEQAFVDAVEYRVRSGAFVSNAACVGIATAPVVMEANANDSPSQSQVLTPPCEVAGRFYPARDNDWYAFEAKQGDAYTIDVISNRLGLPTDPQLVIHQVTTNDQDEEQVKVVATVDDLGTRDRAQFDTRNADAAYQFLAPVDAVYRVTVRDGYSSLRSDPRLVYRLAIRKSQPDFRLVAVPQDPWGALVLRKGDRTTVDVLAERRDGLTEPITLSVSGLPNGVTSTPVTLGPTTTVASLVLTATENVAPGIASLNVVGTAKIGGRDVVRVARYGTANTSMRMLQPNQRPQNSLPARLSRQLMVSIVDSESPFAMELQNDTVWETTRAGILKIPYTATRRRAYKGVVQCAVANLPVNINPTTFSVAANADKGEFQLTLRNNTPPGTYTLHAGAFVTSYSYARNPESAEVAKQRKEAIDKVVAEATEKAKEATTAKQQADKAATDTANLVKAAEQKKTQADSAAKAALAAQKLAEQAIAKAEAAVAANPDEPALQAALAAAVTNQSAVTEKAKSAAATAASAAKEVDEAKAAATAAVEQQKMADLRAAEATAFQKAATDEKKVRDKEATDTERAAKAKNINYWTASTPVTIKIHEFPIALESLPEVTTLKQGDNLELPIKITRLIEYQEQVSLSTIIRGVSGLSVRTMNIPKDKNQIKLPVTVAANATPGTHEITLRATMRVNNQTLTLDQPFKVEIEKVEPEE